MNKYNPLLIILFVLILCGSHVNAQLGPRLGRVVTGATKKSILKPGNIRVPIIRGSVVTERPVGIVTGVSSQRVGLGNILNLQVNRFIAPVPQPLIMNDNLIREGIGNNRLNDIAKIRILMDETWNELSRSNTNWNYRKVLEMKLFKHHLSLEGQDTILDVLTLEQYIMQTGKWPRNMDDPQESILARRISMALRTNYKEYVVALRKLVINVPTVEQTIHEAERFIAVNKRVPGVVYLQSTNTEDLPEISATEKLLGMDLQFLIETDIASSQGEENASLARLRDWYHNYAEIYFVGGIPERSLDGTPNIPVLSTAQWQNKLSRWVYSQPIRALLYPLRPYEYFVQTHLNQGDSVEHASDLTYWNQLEKEEALLYAAQYLSIQAPTLTKAQWDKKLEAWLLDMGEPKYEILSEETPFAVKPFRELGPLEKLEVIFGHIYHFEEYPEEFIARLRKAGEL